MSSSSPHGIGKSRWAEVVLAFEVGGMVTVYEADAYLRLTRGTIKADAIAGRLAARKEPRGNKLRYVIAAKDAEALHPLMKAAQ